MPSKPITSEPNWKKLDPWFKQAADQIARNGGECFAIKSGSPEFREWMLWFGRNMDTAPVFMTEAAKFIGKEVTLPTQWPPA